jgi:putative hydrolase of the HAD superfamily
MIRAVFFDLDGTLYDRDRAILQVAERQFDAFREELALISKRVFLEHLVALDGHGHNRTPRLHHVLAQTLGFSNDLADQLENYFRTHYAGFCTVTDDTRTTLETLKAQGVKLGIITNGPTQWQSHKVESMGIASLFDTILISGSEGVEKPDPRIFARALERCGVLPVESMFVGDHPEADIAGAKSAGLLPVWKQMAYWDAPPDVARIEKLSELLSLTELSQLRIG